MGKCLRILYRITSVIIVAVMLMSVFVCSNAVNAASTGTIQKKEKSYEIAVVFDNSGSMFMNGNKAWSQAKYAMEIFASMLDYENGDKLSIFTMWAVITEDKDIVKGEYWDNFDYNKNISADNFRVDIRNNDDIEKISNMYTVYDPVSKASNTPFAPIQEAYDYLRQSTATDKRQILKKHEHDIIQKIDEVNALFAGYVDSGCVEDYDIKPYNYDFTVMADYTYEMPFFDTGRDIDFMQQGHTVTVPVDYVESITLTREELYD